MNKIRSAAVAMTAFLLVPGMTWAQEQAWEMSNEIRSDLTSLSQAAIAAWDIVPEATAMATRQQTLPLTIPGRGSLNASHRHSIIRAADDFTWMGQLEPDGTDVVLTIKHGLIAGMIYTRDQVFELRAGSPRGPVMLELDQDLFPGCDGGFEPPADFRDPQRRPARADAPSPQPERPAGDETVVMDLLVVYTAAARSGLGGVAQIEATAEAAVANANNAFINSNVNAEFRIVQIAETTLTESSNCGNDLSTLRNNATIAQLRNEVHADMVGMLIAPNYCGCGYVMRNPGPSFAGSAYQITGTHCAVGNLTYAHEHGHNMGMEHDPANGTSPGNASYPWSFGHFQSNSFRTVMSYATECSNCPRRMYFSDPDVNFGGNPTGIADQRHNARTARLNAPIIADFRIPPPALAEIEVAPLSLTFELSTGQPPASQTLTITNTGETDLLWSIAQAEADAARTGHDPQLDEQLTVPDFQLDGGDDSVAVSIPAGISSNGQVTGFTFAGLADVQGNDWASDMRLLLTAPTDESYDVGGYTSVTNPWEFQGTGSSASGTYTSTHHGAFAEVQDDGVWDLLFTHDWSESTSTLSWSNVSLTLHKSGEPVGCDAPVDIPWLSLDLSEGVTEPGSQSSIQVLVDVTDLDEGVHETLLCIDSNDAAMPRVAVPISVELLDRDPLFRDNFENILSFRP